MYQPLGPRGPPRRPCHPAGQLQRLLLALAAALLPALAAAARDCSLGCPLIVDVVCGANRVSYMNPCVAECSGRVTDYTEGYCKGEHVRFAPPRNTSGSAAAKERAAMVPASTMAKFAGQGFSFLGHAPLSRAPLVRKVLHRKESAFSAAASAAQKGAGSSSSSAASGEQQFDAGAALDSIASFTQSPSGQSVKVEVLRGDRGGNVFYKNYVYDPAASDVYSYPPQIPGSGAPPPSPPAAPASAAPKAAESAFVKASPAPQPAPPRPAPASPRLLSPAADPSPAQSGVKAAPQPPSPTPPAQPVQAAPRPATAPRGAFGAMLASAIGFRRASPAPPSAAVARPRSTPVAEAGPAAPQGSSGGSGSGSSGGNSSGAAPGPGPGLGVSIISSKAGNVAAPAVTAAGLGSHNSTPPPSPAPQRQWGGRRLQAAAGEAGPGSQGSAPYDAAALHRVLTVIGGDARLACPAGRYPFGAMGQLSAKAADGTFLCSGALIAPDRVLTAAHCVWDDRQAHAFFEELSFSPAQFKAASGAVEAPEGRAEWEHVTTFKAYVDDPDLPPGLRFDIAVIKLAKPLGLKYGWLGVRAARPPCAKGGEAADMTLAGYPGDDPFNAADDAFLGGCFLDRCRVNITCDQPMAAHACDSYIGQSGAPMYDPAYYVRMVHTLGVLAGITTENSAVVVDKFILDQVMREWTKPALG